MTSSVTRGSNRSPPALRGADRPHAIGLRGRLGRLFFPVTLAEYVADGGARLTDRDVLDFRAGRIPELTRKMGGTEHVADGELWGIARFLLRVAAEYDDYRRSASISPVTRQAVFALQYFLEEDDAIPDSEESLGYTDDVMIGRAMIRGHAEELKPFADACGQPWQWD